MPGHPPNTLIAQLDERVRVMLSGFDPPQWLLQFRREKGDRWDTMSYHRNKESLLRYIGAAGEGGEGIKVIKALPDTCPDPRMPLSGDSSPSGGDSEAGGSYPSLEG